jgi:hypothetical protein
VPQPPRARSICAPPFQQLNDDGPALDDLAAMRVTGAAPVPVHGRQHRAELVDPGAGAHRPGAVSIRADSAIWNQLLSQHRSRIVIGRDGALAIK